MQSEAMRRSGADEQRRRRCRAKRWGRAAQMSSVAAIDCGTNSIRLLIVDALDGQLRDVHREMRIVRLGQGVDATGAFAPEALQRTRSALVDYAALCPTPGVERIRGVAASTTRRPV